MVLDNPTASAASLAARLQRRSVDAVEIVRQGIHAFHSGQNTSMLSQEMLRILRERRTCAVCGAAL